MRHIAVILSVVCAIMVAGAAVAYCFQSDTSFSVTGNDDGTVSIRASGMLPEEVTYRLLSDTEVPDRIYMYLDEDYTGDLVSYRDQNRYLSSFMNLLSERGYRTAELVDAKRLALIVSDPSSASGSAVLFASGAIPETVYPSDSENMMEDWLDNGGTVYWAGPDMGRFRATSDGKTVEVPGGGVFGDGINVGPDEPCRVFETSDISEVMGFTDCYADFGLKRDYLGSKVLGLYDEYSSLSVVPVSAGRMYVLGERFSNLEVEQIYAFADIVVCGITENTSVKDSGSFHKGYGDHTERIDVAVTAGDTLYVTAGKPASFGGTAFRY